MSEPSGGSPGRVDRRTVLESLAVGGLAATSGCVRQVRSIVTREPSDRLSLTITTVPADVDRESIELARRLRDHLDAVGIETTLDLLAAEEFNRQVLINQNFDLYVGRHPGGADPDFLYEALHSVFADESGWQNPFGFTNLAFDERLEAQRRLEGETRRDEVARLLRALANEQPFVPICVPREQRLVRDDRFAGWDDHHLDTRLGYLGLEPLESDDRLRTVVTDARVTANLNPLSAEYRDRETFVDLLYDSLGTLDGDEIRPWLAESWEWDGAQATVTLRPDCYFHDGERVTSADVAFTYRLLEDTSVGESDVPSPPPRYRGAGSVVESVEVDDYRRFTITVNASQEVAEHAFTVPIFPEHVWSERTDDAEIPGVTVAQGTTEAVVTDNVPAIGSGPFAFEEASEREHVLLERFDDHFTLRDDEDDGSGENDEGNQSGENDESSENNESDENDEGDESDRSEDSTWDLPEPTVEELRIGVEPRSASAIAAIEGGGADVTTSPLEAYAIEEVTETDEIRLLESPSRTFYHVGFNVRNTPFSNPYFRRVLARLLDKESVVEEVFEGYADPVATPLTGDWVPSHLEWDGRDPEVPFLGTDGELNEDAARDAFVDAGFRYDEDGYLLVRD